MYNAWVLRVSGHSKGNKIPPGEIVLQESGGEVQILIHLELTQPYTVYLCNSKIEQLIHKCADCCNKDLAI